MTRFAAETTPYFNNGVKEIPVRDDNSLALLEAYRQDYLDMTFDEAYREIPIGYLEMNRKMENGRRTGLEFTVLPSFTRTINFLKEHQAYELAVIDPESIASLTVSWYVNTDEYEPDYEVDGNGNAVYSTSGQITEEFSDPEDLRQIAPYLVNADLADRAFVVSASDWSIDVVVEGADNDAGYAADFNAHTICFARDRLPGVVKKLVEK